MRWFLYALVIANVATLYMNVQAARREEAARPPLQNNFDSVTTLIRLSDVPAEELRRRGEPEAVPEIVNNQEVASSSTPPQTTTNDESPAPTDFSGQTISTASASASPPTGVSTRVAETPAQSPEMCFRVGPINEASDVKAIRAWFAAKSIGVVEREGKRREVSRYWVHLPRFPDANTAKAVYQQLESNGLEDMHVVRRGNMANTLSLGVYKQRDSMERRVERLTGLGHKPVVTERFKSVRATWLDGTVSTSVALPHDAFKDAFKRHPLTFISCNSMQHLLRASALPKIERPNSG